MGGPFDGLDVDSLLGHFPEWAHFAQLGDMVHQLFNGGVDLMLRREPAEAEVGKGARFYFTLG